MSWLLQQAKKKQSRARGSSRHSGGAQDNIAVTPKTATRRENYVRTLTPEAQELADEAKRVAQEAKDEARQIAQEDRDLARQDRDEDRQAKLDDREYARQEKLQAREDADRERHPERYEPDASDETSDQDDDVSGNLARRIAASKGVNELWRDAHPLIVGGWFDDLKGTLGKYKGYIKQGAGYAAGAVATVYGGPAAGKIAKELADKCVDAAYGDDQAKAVIARATVIAHRTGNADQLNILNIAKQAAKEQTAAYHVADAANAAKAGDPAAQAYVANLPDSMSVKIANGVMNGSSGGYGNALSLMVSR
jgi:hypothetical protein